MYKIKFCLFGLLGIILFPKLLLSGAGVSNLPAPNATFYYNPDGTATLVSSHGIRVSVSQDGSIYALKGDQGLYWEGNDGQVALTEGLTPKNTLPLNTVKAATGLIVDTTDVQALEVASPRDQVGDTEVTVSNTQMTAKKSLTFPSWYMDITQ